MQRFSHTLDSLRNARAARLTAFRLLPSARQRTVPADFLLVDVTPHGQPIYRMPLNLYAALTTGVTPLRLGELGISLQGKGMIVGVWDAGKVADHIELGDRVIFKEEAALHPHAAHVTGTLISTGINMYTKGMAPLAQAKTWYYDNDYDDFYNQIGPDGVKLSNHSYGSATGWVKTSTGWVWAGDPAISDKEDYRFGFYDLDAQYIDELSNLDPYHLFVWAAGNDRAEVSTGYPKDGNEGTGYDCLIPEANAKNHIVVGAVFRVTSYTGPSSVTMSNFSSWGPTDDGRIKPDVVADGVNVYSLTSSPANGYLQSSGTSQATANVTGSLILVQELYNRLHNNASMRAATLRALAIHTVKEAGTDPGPDYQNGWGLLDVKQAAQTLLDHEDVNVMVRELTLNDQQTINIPLQPTAGHKITATLCWTDPAGTPVAYALDPTNLMLVNDLDIKLVDEDGNETLPWILDPANPSVAATHGNNFRDNVEKIELDAPLDKNYTLVITHKGTLAQAQPFSLIVTHQSRTTGTAYYWVGNSGNWSDVAHWSLSSGGTSASVVPTVSDRVIVDDNSFSSDVEETITLDGDASCRSLTWLTSEPAALDMGAHTLTAATKLMMLSDTFRISTPGTFILNEHGQAQLRTNLSNASLQSTAGVLTIGEDFKGPLTIGEDGNLILDGDNNLDTAKITGNWKLNGSNTVKYFQASADAQIQLAEQTTQTLDTLWLAATSNARIALQSTGSQNAAFAFSRRLKLCNDYLDIDHVNVTGLATVVAGTHSVVTEAEGWLKDAACDDVLYADFDVAFICEQGLASFKDKSSGPVEEWTWNFGDEGSTDNITTGADASHLYDHTGTYTVTLTVKTPAGDIQTNSRSVEIQTATAPSNAISYDQGMLISSQTADHYQWYRNGELIENATEKTFATAGGGKYAVLITVGPCSYMSDEYLVTATEPGAEQVYRFSPNPADRTLVITTALRRCAVSIYTAMGQYAGSASSETGTVQIDTSQLHDGLYIADLSGYKIKFVVLHH